MTPRPVVESESQFLLQAASIGPVGRAGGRVGVSFACARTGRAARKTAARARRNNSGRPTAGVHGLIRVLPGPETHGGR